MAIRRMNDVSLICAVHERLLHARRAFGETRGVHRVLRQNKEKGRSRDEARLRDLLRRVMRWAAEGDPRTCKCCTANQSPDLLEEDAECACLAQTAQLGRPREASS